MGRRMPEEDARQIKRWKANNDTSHRSGGTARPVTPHVGRGSAKLCCTGPTTAASFEKPARLTRRALLQERKRAPQQMTPSRIDAA
jgi:hypothetical protein